MADPTIIPGVNTTVPLGEPVKPAATPVAQPTVTPGLEKFVGEKGAVDVDKLGASYLEAEKSFHQKEAEAAQLRTAIAALSENLTGVRQGIEPPKPPSSEDQLKEFVQDPQAFVGKILEEMGRPLAKEVSMASLHAKHPELKEPTFAKEVGIWVESLPASVRALEDTLEGADFLTNLYKTQKGKAVAPTQPNAPATITPSGQPAMTGTVYSSRELRKLQITNPMEYSRRMPEIETAYREGRVTD